MIVNFCNKGERRIIVNGNEVEYFYRQEGNIDHSCEKIEEYRKDVFSFIKVITINNHQLLEGNKKSKKENTIVSISRCKTICKISEKTIVEYIISCEELYVKTTEPEGRQTIYDEEGNLIASETEYNITVIFAGCGNVLQKTNKKDGKSKLYSFEGGLIC